MKFVFLSPSKKPAYVLLFLMLMSLTLSLTIVRQPIEARQVQLSLADILIGLRSKKVTLAERNTLLTEAVKTRGITFSLTPEIEKELVGTGASTELVEAIRLKSPKILPNTTPSQTPISTSTPIQTPTPIPTPTPFVPNSAFYQKRASVHLINQEYDSAAAEYSKAIELDAKDPGNYLNRGLAFFKQKNFDPAISDFDKAIELNPGESMMYFNRGDLHEKMGNLQKAAADYRKAFELDATNEPAKTNLRRLESVQAKTQIKPSVKTEIPLPKTSSDPQIVNVGALNNIAVKLAVPVYTAFDRQRNLQGLIRVQVILDETGKVISAKASAGPPTLRLSSEEAIRNSKFKPVLVKNQAVKATGFINYNFKAS